MAKFAAKDSNKNITLSPHGSGKVVVGTGATDATVQSDGNHNLVLQTGNSTTGSISITDGADGNIALTPNGVGDIVVGSGANAGKITSSGTHNLELYTNAGTNSGFIKIIDGADQNIDIVPNGTGQVYMTKVDIDSGAVDGITLGTNSAVTEAQIDNINVNGNAITSTNTDGNIDLTPNGTGEVNISKVDIDSGTIDGTDVTVGSGKTLDVSAGTLTTSTAQKQTIVQAGPGSGTLDVSSGTFTTSTAQKNAIVDGATGSTFNGTIGTSASGFGLVTHADQWRLSADVTSEGIITTNFEQVDTDSFSPIGSSMTESSGIFQFPATGTWWIGAVGAMVTTSATQFSGVYIHTNISGVTATRTAVLGNGNGTSYYIGTFSNLIFNVTNTSTHKCSFEFNSSGASHSRILGDTNINYTHFTFIRLGDT